MSQQPVITAMMRQQDPTTDPYFAPPIVDRDGHLHPTSPIMLEPTNPSLKKALAYDRATQPPLPQVSAATLQELGLPLPINHPGNLNPNLQFVQQAAIDPLKTSYGVVIWNAALIDTLTKLGQWILAIQQTFNLGPNGELLYMVDPDVVAATGIARKLDDFMDNLPPNIARRVDWQEGYPTINGVPIWERIEGELPEYYGLFKAYRGQLEAGRLSRSIMELARNAKVPGHALNALCQVFHWHARTRAYDTYMEQVERDANKRRIKRMENKHFDSAGAILEQVTDLLADPDRLGSMSNKDMIELMKVSTEMQRLSAGLFPNKPMDASQATAAAKATAANMQGATINNIQVTNDSGIKIGNGIAGQPGSLGDGGKGAASGGARISEILEVLAQCGSLSPLQKSRAIVLDENGMDTGKDLIEHHMASDSTREGLPTEGVITTNGTQSSPRGGAEHDGRTADVHGRVTGGSTRVVPFGGAST